MGAFPLNPKVLFFSCVGIILAASYSNWFLNGIGFVNAKYYRLSSFQDISRKSFAQYFFFYLILFIRIFPNIDLSDIYFSVLNLLEHFFAIQKLEIWI